MKIAGFQKQSLIDYPGNISAVIFTQGCNFRCGYCHNPELVLPSRFKATYDEEEVFNYLKKYNKLLTAVCITGGEPSIHKDLPVFIEKIKTLGLKVKLDSNGTNPSMLKTLINNKMIDYIAMDIKHKLEFELYNKTVGYWIHQKTFDNITTSIELIKNSSIDYEFRTTIVKGLHIKEDVACVINEFGSPYKLQNFKDGDVLNSNLDLSPFPKQEFEDLISLCQ